MRWFVIILLISLAGLLFAAGALARHVWLQHRNASTSPDSGPDAGPSVLPGQAEEGDNEAER
ncbi:MAG: hypothetical protein WCE75_16740 [Terracidiphilus sp.]